MSLPPGYFESLADVEERHWWYRGMRTIAAALLRAGGSRSGSLLDAGCGTGGFLAWAAAAGYGPLAGIDPAEEAVSVAQARVPGADLRVGELARLPFDDASFDVVTCNDVLQHVHERDGDASLRELHRVLRPGGVLVVRTNGGRHARRDAPDWRLFDRATLARELEDAGFCCERVSYANLVGSAAAALRRRSPRAPTATGHGIPAPTRPHRGLSALLAVEAALIRRGVPVPFGHTLVALAVPSSTTRSPVAADR